MQREFPDESQRAAVCHRQWRTKRGSLHSWSPLTGLWAVLPEWLQAYYPQIQALQDDTRLGAVPQFDIDSRTFTPSDLIQRAPYDLAVIPLHGPMIKRAGFFEMLFGFTGSDSVREAIDLAALDPEIKGIMLAVESPGGHVAGVHELSEAVRAARRHKPIAVHMDDLGASAAYWASAHASRITASPTTEVGSLGTMAVLADLSQAAAFDGIKVHVISTGPYKGLGVPGAPIAPEHLEEVQRRVDGVNAYFQHAVRAGRALTEEQLARASDGRVFLAQEAKRLGLIDEVRSYSAALRELGRMATTGRADPLRADIAARRTALEGIDDAHCGIGSENQEALDE